MADIRARLTLDSSLFARGIRAAESAAHNFASSISRVGGIAAGVGAKIAGIVGGVVGPTAFAIGIKRAADFGAELEHLSARTGASVRSLALLDQVFRFAGLSADRLGPAINRMQKALTGINEEGQPTNAFLRRLVANIDEFRRLDPGTQFVLLGKSIASLPTPAERAAAAMGIFGRTGGELLQIFRDPKVFARAAEFLGQQPEVLARNATVLERISSVFGSIGVKLRGFFLGVLDRLAPAISAAAEALARIDLTAAGQRFGARLAAVVNVVTNAIRTDRFGELLAASLKAGFASALDFLVSGFVVAAGVLKDVITNADIGRVIVVSVLTAGASLTAALIKAFQHAIDFLLTGLDFALSRLPDRAKRFLGLRDLLGNPTFAELYARNIEASNRAGMGRVAAHMQQVAKIGLEEAFESAAPAAENLASILKDRLSEFKLLDIFGSAKYRAELDALAKQLNVPVQTVVDAAKGTVFDLGQLVADSAEKIEKAYRIREIEVDPFARVGLFAQAAGLDVSRSILNSIAEHTRRTAERLNQPLTVRFDPSSIVAVAG